MPIPITRSVALALGLSLLAGCGSSPARVFAEPPRLGVRVQSTDDLRNLPPPRNKLHVAVFAFQDQTGQHRPNDQFAEYSFAVTQGGASILMNALKDAGRSQWFSVLERSRLGDLFQERQIIRANRSEHSGPNGQPLPPLGPLLNAGILLQGGIIAYEKNLLTGGLGANFLGIGADTRYRRDSVSVYLRAVSVLTGEVLVSVNTDKTIYSSGLQGQAFQYVAFNRLLQVETGITTNEPSQLAVRQAIEKAVYALVLDGSARGYWTFADPAAARPLVQEYLTQRDGAEPVVAAAPAPPPREEAAAPAPIPAPAMPPAAPAPAPQLAQEPPRPVAPRLAVERRPDEGPVAAPPTRPAALFAASLAPTPLPARSVVQQLAACAVAANECPAPPGRRRTDHAQEPSPNDRRS